METETTIHVTVPAGRMMGEAGSACDEQLTDVQYEVASRVLDALGDRAGRDFSVSQIARLGGVRADYDDVAAALDALLTDGHVANVGRGGAWARYRFVWG